MILGLFPLRLAIVLIAIIALTGPPLQANARGHGGGHSRSYTPRSYTPRSYTPRSRAPRSYTPRSYTPRSYTPRSNTPHSYRPHSYRPHHLNSTAWLDKYSSNVYMHPGGHRSLAEKHLFWEQSGHPRGWPGHVVDHRLPLACGGSDTPSNMQWQTIAEGKAKDKWERKGCTHH